MEVRYDSDQDLTLILAKEEEILLIREQTGDFFNNPLKGVCKTLEAYVFLAYSLDKSNILTSNILTSAKNMEGLGKILIPDPALRGHPWLINLSDEGIKHLRSGWDYGIRYNGSNKLFIKGLN